MLASNFTECVTMESLSMNAKVLATLSVGGMMEMAEVLLSSPWRYFKDGCCY